MQSNPDLLSIVCCLGISAAFYFVRSRIAFFNILCGFLIALFIILIFGFPLASVEKLILVVGLMLYWFGLLAIRIMLRRSVSLQILENCVAGRPVSIRENLASRLEDMIRYKLVHRHEGIFRLTLLGNFIALVVSFAYLAVRIQK